MKKKWNIEKVQNLFLERGYKLIEGQTYESYTVPLVYICEKHSDKGQLKITLKDFLTGRGCRLCGYEKVSEQMKNEISDEQLHSEFSKSQLVLLPDQTYISMRHKLKCICLKHVDHGIQEISLTTLQKGQSTKCCRYEKMIIKNTKNTYQDIISLLESEGCSLITSELPNLTVDTPFEFYCPEGHLCLSTLYRLNKGKYCWQCGVNKRSKEHHHRWQGGITELNIHLRLKTTKWKFESLKKYDFKCAVTGINDGTLEIHHLYPFHKIVKDTLEELNYPIKSKIGEYHTSELLKIEEVFSRRNDELLGVPITRKLHELFHSIYGYDNSATQFNEFVKLLDSGYFEVELIS